MSSGVSQDSHVERCSGVHRCEPLAAAQSNDEHSQRPLSAHKYNSESDSTCSPTRPRATHGTSMVQEWPGRVASERYTEHLKSTSGISPPSVSPANSSSWS
eukprot:COSAG05_NODE_540_length_8845_cov_13.872742_11_plen_101_part_00